MRSGYERFSDKCVDITFSTSKNVMPGFDINIEKSEISTGASVGDLTELSDNKYVYSHPIKDTEKEVIISFCTLKVTDKIDCDIEF